jgi:hypothetical protein
VWAVDAGATAVLTSVQLNDNFVWRQRDSSTNIMAGGGGVVGQHGPLLAAVSGLCLLGLICTLLHQDRVHLEKMLVRSEAARRRAVADNAAFVSVSAPSRPLECRQTHMHLYAAASPTCAAAAPAHTLSLTCSFTVILIRCP